MSVISEEERAASSKKRLRPGAPRVPPTPDVPITGPIPLTPAQERAALIKRLESNDGNGDGDPLTMKEYMFKFYWLRAKNLAADIKRMTEDYAYHNNRNSAELAELELKRVGIKEDLETQWTAILTFGNFAAEFFKTCECCPPPRPRTPTPPPSRGPTPPIPEDKKPPIIPLKRRRQIPNTNSFCIDLKTLNVTFEEVYDHINDDINDEKKIGRSKDGLGREFRVVYSLPFVPSKKYIKYTIDVLRTELNITQSNIDKMNKERTNKKNQIQKLKKENDRLKGKEGIDAQFKRDDIAAKLPPLQHALTLLEEEIKDTLLLENSKIENLIESDAIFVFYVHRTPQLESHLIEGLFSHWAYRFYASDKSDVTLVGMYDNMKSATPGDELKIDLPNNTSQHILFDMGADEFTYKVPFIYKNDTLTTAKCRNILREIYYYPRKNAFIFNTESRQISFVETFENVDETHGAFGDDDPLFRVIFSLPFVPSQVYIESMRSLLQSQVNENPTADIETILTSDNMVIVTLYNVIQPFDEKNKKNVYGKSINIDMMMTVDQLEYDQETDLKLIETADIKIYMSMPKIKVSMMNLMSFEKSMPFILKNPGPTQFLDYKNKIVACYGFAQETTVA